MFDTKLWLAATSTDGSRLLPGFLGLGAVAIASDPDTAGRMSQNESRNTAQYDPAENVVGRFTHHDQVGLLVFHKLDQTFTNVIAFDQVGLGARRRGCERARRRFYRDCARRFR